MPVDICDANERYTMLGAKNRAGVYFLRGDTSPGSLRGAVNVRFLRSLTPPLPLLFFSSLSHPLEFIAAFD